MPMRVSGLIFEMHSKTCEKNSPEFWLNKYLEHFLCILQLSELEQRVIEAEERAEEAEDKVRVHLPNASIDDSFKFTPSPPPKPKLKYFLSLAHSGSCDGTETNWMAIEQ